MSFLLYFFAAIIFIAIFAVKLYKNCTKMKLLKVFGIFAVLMMTVALSSCVKNDDSEDLDKKWQDWVKQVDTEIKASVGTYEGKLYTKSNESTEAENKLDSIPATWRINNDSTLDLLNVPVELLVNWRHAFPTRGASAQSAKRNLSFHV